LKTSLEFCISRTLIKDEDEDCENLKQDNKNYEYVKELRLWDKRFDDISRDNGVFLIFLFFLYFVSFSNLSDSSFIYNELFQTTFVQAQSPNEKGLDEVKLALNFRYELLNTVNLSFLTENEM
jgi:hypothetical protein